MDVDFDDTNEESVTTRALVARSGATPIVPRGVRRVEPTVSAGSSFIYIIGHVGSAATATTSTTSAAARLAAKQQSTYIGTSSNPGEAIRQFNNTQRGTCPAVICVCIFVPGWRRLAAQELVQLWHRSRKLACRMRFGIMMACELNLPCFVSPLALTGDATRRALPHLVARYEREQSELAKATDDDGVDGEWRDDLAGTAPSKTKRKRRSASTSSATTTITRTSRSSAAPTRRRTRRPSMYEQRVTAHVQFGDLSADVVMQTMAACIASERPAELDERALDRLNTIVHNGATVCFTQGKQRPPKLVAASAVKARKPRRKSTVQASALTGTDDDDAGDSDDEDDDNDDNDEESARQVTTTARPKRKRLEVADDEAALAPLRQRNQQELAVYQRTSSEKSATPTLLSSSSDVETTTTTSSTTAAPLMVSAGQRAAQECTVDGTLDNRTLVERADECFTDANEYIARPLKRVHIERVQRCVCGSRDSYVGGVCRDCRRTTSSVRVVRTNIAALREQATNQPCSPHDRREISRLVVRAERETPIDEYIRATTEQLREALQQQQHEVAQQNAFRTRQHADTSTSSPRGVRQPKEMRFISATLMQTDVCK